MTPFVSVLTPTIAGREWFLRRCRNSVTAQTYEHVGHVVVDGNGLTPTQAFQQALDQASGEYVIPVSDDDWIAPHTVETLLPYLDEHEVVFARSLLVRPGFDRLVEVGGAVMWKKTLTDRLGGFNVELKHSGDSDLYSRFAYYADCAYHPEPLYFVEDHDGADSNVNVAGLAQELDAIKTRFPYADLMVKRMVERV